MQSFLRAIAPEYVIAKKPSAVLLTIVAASVGVQLLVGAVGPHPVLAVLSMCSNAAGFLCTGLLVAGYLPIWQKARRVRSDD